MHLVTAVYVRPDKFGHLTTCGRPDYVVIFHSLHLTDRKVIARCVAYAASGYYLHGSRNNSAKSARAGSYFGCTVYDLTSSRHAQLCRNWYPGVSLNWDSIRCPTLDHNTTIALFGIPKEVSDRKNSDSLSLCSTLQSVKT